MKSRANKIEIVELTGHRRTFTYWRMDIATSLTQFARAFNLTREKYAIRINGVDVSEGYYSPTVLRQIVNPR